MTFREFVEHMKGATTAQVAYVTGARDIVPMAHFARDDMVQSVAIDAAWIAPESKALLIEQVILPFIDVMRPEFVAWTFTGRRGTEDGEFDHETAVALCIERERHETWLARLVRHDDRASLGAWRSWPPNEQDGLMLTPIQRALR